MADEAGGGPAVERKALAQLVEKKLALLSELMQRPWQIRWIKRRDPEQYKAFSRIESRLLELRLRIETDPGRELPVATLTAVVAQVSAELSREGAWDVAENLKWLLLHTADDEYLAALVDAERHASVPDVVSWARKFGADDAADVPSKVPADAAARDTWRRLVMGRLTALYEARLDLARHDRAKLQLRANYLLAVAIVLGIFLALSAFCNVTNGLTFEHAPDPKLLTALAAGALGSVLSGVYKLRDQMMGIRQLRSFGSVLGAQPFVGATAAMLVDLIVTSGVVKIGSFSGTEMDWRYHAILGFVAGFSEPFFLGIVGHVSNLKERGAEAEPAEGGEPVARNPAPALRNAR